MKRLCMALGIVVGTRMTWARRAARGLLVVFSATAGSLVLAADNDSGPEPDIEGLCLASGGLCYDACSQAAMTGKERSKCNEGCRIQFDACMSGDVASGGPARGKRKGMGAARPSTKGMFEQGVKSPAILGPPDAKPAR